MHVSIPSRVLRSLAASALVLGGATACSRPDRGDSSASMAQDTASIAPDQTGSTTGGDSVTGVPTDAPRSATASPSAERRDTSMTDSAAGYRAMDRDTATVRNESDSARVTHDSSETSLAPSDTATVEMARDTSTISDQVDTVTISDTAGTLQTSIDTSHNAEPSDSGHAGAVLAAGAAGAAVAAGRDDAGSNDDRVDTSTGADHGDSVSGSDSAGIAAEIDTVAVSDTAGTLQASADTSDSGRAGAVVAAGAAGATVGAIAGRDNDAALESERVRSPEDSTEILGNVTSYETADEEPVNRTDEVGAAAVAGTLTGAGAIGLMTRQGAQCSVVDPESDEVVRWDMASTPVTLNPCGLGSMNLSKVSTAGQRVSGTAGQ